MGMNRGNDLMKFLLRLVAVLLLVTTTHAQSPAPRTLKMQASWPSTVTAWDNFRFIAERLDKTTGGAIKIETLTAASSTRTC